MKKTRRIAAMVAAMALAATMMVPATMMTASAATGGTNTITINPGTGDDLTHSDMKAFQIFTGTAGSVQGTLNVTGWGDGITPATFVNALKAVDVVVVEADNTDPENPVAAKTLGDLITALNVTTYDASSAVAVADVLATLNDNSAAAEAVARAAFAAKTSTNTGSFTAAVAADPEADPPTTAQAAKITGVADGYYAVFDMAKATKPGATEGTYTLGLLKVSKSENVDITTKASLPTFEKKIMDVNDSSATLTKSATAPTAYTGTWTDDADHDMGDKVPFKLTATIPSNYDDYKAYRLTMHDNLQASVFSLDTTSFVVYYENSSGVKTAIPSTEYTLTTTGLTTDASFSGFSEDTTEDFQLSFTNLKTAVPAVAAGDKIVVEYTATLTTDANVGTAGNWNGAYLEYSNNPNWDGSGTPDTDKTSEDTVVCFTYKTDFTKIDEVTGSNLQGAVFSLYKEYETAPTGGVACTESGYTSYYRVGTAQTSGADGKFGWTGLDDGDYVLVEDTAPTDPSGGTYTTISPIAFTISGTHTDKVLTELNGISSSSANTAIDLSSGFVPLASDSTKNANVVLANGEIDASVANSKDTKLPSTGGMGTMLFLGIGGAVAAGAGITLISKKRSKDEDEQ